MAAKQLINADLKKLFDVYISNFNNGFWAAKDAYHAEAYKKLSQLLSKKKWSCETFININSALILYPEIISCIRGKPKDQKQSFDIESINISDVHEITKKLLENNYSNSVFNKILARSDLKLRPIEWLIIAEEKGMKVDQTLSKRIKFAHWDLDHKLAEDGISKGLTLNINEAADLLSEAVGANISHKNVIELCLMRFTISFGSYLNLDLYNIKTAAESCAAYESTKLSQSIFFDGDYKYNVPGLVRLVKHFDPKIGLLQGQTLEHLSNTSKIVLANDNRLPLQQSISNQILGIIQSIQCVDTNMLTIDLNSLVFVKHEIIDFINCNIDELNKIFRAKTGAQKQNKDLRLMSRPQIKTTYIKIPKRTWDDYLNQKNKNCVPLAVKGENSKQDKFAVVDVHKWLIDNNKYTPEELEKYTTNYELI